MKEKTQKNPVRVLTLSYVRAEKQLALEKSWANTKQKKNETVHARMHCQILRGERKRRWIKITENAPNKALPTFADQVRVFIKINGL